MTDVDRDPEIVEIFVAESLEALDRLESLLIEAEGGSPQPDMLDVLFRDIHTIKGTSGYLSFDRILSISHVGEDLLENQEMCAIGPFVFQSWHPSRRGRAPRAAIPPARFPERRG